MIDSSTSSAESSFRELDEVFLQTQTRIWIGEVLQTRFDEDLHISDLLRDGEILLEVSKVVWNLLLTKCMELRHLKHKYGPFGSKKSSGRYRPYSNVDTFLKTCKILGLSGIDLFSPSDVVEKRDIRKVCICIRALSKKARSKQLSVPDFDMVIYSVAMPTDMVGVIRRSLESSQCTLSSSSSYSYKGSHAKLKQKNLYAPSNRDDDSSSEGSDEAESRYMGENAFSSASKFDYADGVNSDLENLPEAYSLLGQYRRRNVLESDAKCQCTEEFKHRQFKSASLSAIVQSFSPQILENDHELDKMSSCCKSSQRKLYHGVSHENNNERQNCRKGSADVSSINCTLENDESVVGDSSCVNAGESDYISEYLAFSDLMVHATDGSNPAILDGENNMFDFFLNVDSGLTSDKRSFKNGSQRRFSDDEDMEVSSTTSMSSVLGRLLNLEFDDQFDEDDSSSSNVCSSVSKENKAEKQYEDPLIISEPPKADIFSLETREVAIPDYAQETLCEDDDLLQCGENHISTDFGRRISENHPHMPVKDLNIAHEDGYGIQDNISSAAENGGQDKREHDPSIVTESISDEKKPTSPQLPPVKHGRRPLLKTVVKGTAIAGVLFLLLHISRKSKGNNMQETKQHAQVMKHKGSKSSSGKQQRGSVRKGIYPAEKIKLGS